MALRAKKPEAIKKRLKLMLYGEAGVGKSYAASAFPNAYYFDCERGVEEDDYIKRLIAGKSKVFQTTDIDEVISDIRELLTTKHDFRTVVIDPFTPLYADLVDRTEARMIRAGEDTGWGRHYGIANKTARPLLQQMLTRLDMNVIIICHAKILYSEEGMKRIGYTFDGYKKLDYLFDLVLFLSKQGNKRIAEVRKTRVKAFPDGDTFEWSYEAFVERCGPDIERVSVPVVLATATQVTELERLVEAVKLPDGTTDKWLSKAGVARFADLPEAAITACIDLCKKKIGVTE